MNSVQLTAKCFGKGLLSKEAALDVLEVRNKMIKEAISLRIGTSFAGKNTKKLTGGGDGFLGKLKSSLGMGGVERGLSGKSGHQPLEWSQSVGNLVKLLGAGAALQGGALGVGAIVKHRKDKKLKGQIQQSYGEMMKEYPKLQEKDRGKVSRTFGVLARYAPSLAADPMVAGSWVQTAVEMSFIDPDNIRRLSDTQTAIDRAHEERSLMKPGSFGKGLQIAQSALG